VLLSTRLVDADEYASFALKNDPRPLWRALGARSLVEDDYVAPRRPLFRDLDERVRLSALEAAVDFSSTNDFDAILEAARLDPLPAARSAAARALGRTKSGGAALALRELWTRADPELREAIADGWGASFDVGGRESLRWAAENETGRGAIAAAIELARRAPDGSDDEAAAVGVLTRAIKLGTRVERVFAMTSAPATPPILDALRESKSDSDPAVAIAALSRLHRELAGAERKAAADKLLEIAKTDLAEAARAQSELAELGDERVVPLLDKALASQSGPTRALAARAFVALGRAPRAARALSDRDTDVRTEVACAILAARD
jgi:HEAT repeat protein